MMPELHLPQVERFKAAAQKVPGYSWFTHYLFFDSLLFRYPQMYRFLVLGVYHGRDMAFLLDLMAKYKRTEHKLIGVDWFQDKASTDWPPHLKDKNWEATGFGPAPTYETTLANLKPFKHAGVDCQVVQSEDESYLTQAHKNGVVFDVVYIDTAHDYETVNRQLQQVRPLVHQGSIVCGDDYKDVPRWGVKQAVADNFTDWKVWDSQIWYAYAEDFK